MTPLPVVRRVPGEGAADRGGGRRMPGRHHLLIIAALAAAALSLPSGPATAEIRVLTELDRPVVQQGQAALLRITVEGAARVEEGPWVPDVDGLDIRSAGQSTSVSIVNARVTRSITYQFSIRGVRPGKYTIGPVEVKDRGKLHRGDPVQLEVTAGPPASPAPGSAGSERGPAGDGDATEGGELFVRAVVDRDRVYVGQQVTLMFRFYQFPGVPLLESPQYSPPSMEGFWREDLSPQRTRNEIVNGRTYQVTEIAYALFPTQSGTLTIGQGHLDCRVRDRGSGRGRRDPFDFFGSVFQDRRVRLSTKPLTVRVDPLPQPQPDDFTGGVGDFSIRSELERPVAGQNEPVTLTLTVEGMGNASTVGDPVIPDVPGVRVYTSSSEVSASREGDIVGGSKTIRAVLVPESTGPRTIPSIGLSYFDPKARAYRRAETQPLSLTVEPGRTAAGGTAGGGVSLRGRDLRTIRPATRLRRVGEEQIWAHRGFWALQGVPLVLLGAALVWRTRRRRMESNWGEVLSRGAPGRLRTDVRELMRDSGPDLQLRYDRLDQSLERFFTDRYRFPVRGRAREDLLRVLQAGGATEDAARMARDLLDRCDFARFASQIRTEDDLLELCELALKTADALAPARRGGLGRGRRAATVVALALLAGSPVAMIASSSDGLSGGGLPVLLSTEEADRAFERGNEAYGRGSYSDAAREYARVLAGGYDSPDLMLNLGNAHYRDGEPGWAVFFFERGRLLDPSDPDLRTNLELVLEETVGDSPERGGSRFLEALVRIQDRVSLSQAVRTASILWWLTLLYAAVRIAFSGPGGSVRMSGAAARVPGTVLILMLCAALLWTGMKALQMTGAPDAVVVAGELDVRSNPDAKATLEFTLNAGTQVRLGRRQEGFTEVLLGTRMRGWADFRGLASLHPDDLHDVASRLAAAGQAHHEVIHASETPHGNP